MDFQLFKNYEGEIEPKYLPDVPELIDGEYLSAAMRDIC